MSYMSYMTYKYYITYNCYSFLLSSNNGLYIVKLV